MAKSARSSAIKKNNQHLKKKVFGPVETARNDRLSAKLLELAQQPKPAHEDTSDAAAETKEDSRATEDVDMDADGTTTKRADRSNSALKRAKISKAAKIEKKRVRKPRNTIVFKKHPKKAQGVKKR